MENDLVEVQPVPSFSQHLLVFFIAHMFSQAFIFKLFHDPSYVALIGLYSTKKCRYLTLNWANTYLYCVTLLDWYVLHHTHPITP